MRFTYTEAAPENAENFEGMKFDRSQSETKNGTRFYLKAWRPKGKKPFAYYTFSDELSRERWINTAKESYAMSIKSKQQRKIADKAARQAMAEKMPVGTLLHYSWGYDQTQCDYFEVVERPTQFKVIMREIASERTRESSDMSDYRIPCPGQFIGKPISKIVSAYGIKMDCGSATPTEEDQEHYCSWYA